MSSIEHYLEEYHPVEYHSLLRIVYCEDNIETLPSDIYDIIPFLVSEFKKICKNFAGSFSYCSCENTCEIYTNLDLKYFDELDRYLKYLNDTFDLYSKFILVIKKYIFEDKITIGIILHEFHMNEEERSNRKKELYDLFVGHETIENMFPN